MAINTVLISDDGVRKLYVHLDDDGEEVGRSEDPYGIPPMPFTDLENAMTMLAANGTLTVEQAASVTDRTPEELTATAEAWGVVASLPAPPDEVSDGS